MHNAIMMYSRSRTSLSSSHFCMQHCAASSTTSQNTLPLSQSLALPHCRHEQLRPLQLQRPLRLFWQILFWRRRHHSRCQVELVRQLPPHRPLQQAVATTCVNYPLGSYKQHLDECRQCIGALPDGGKKEPEDCTLGSRRPEAGLLGVCWLSVSTMLLMCSIATCSHAHTRAPTTRGCCRWQPSASPPALPSATQ